jgi:glucose-6-phosphate isomerase
MPDSDITRLAVWDKLKKKAEEFEKPHKHLKHLIDEKDRLKRFSKSLPGVFLDYSRQRVDGEVMGYLFELAKSRGVLDRFRQMTDGKKVNGTENRAALHTAARRFPPETVYIDDRDAVKELHTVREQFQRFSRQVHDGEIRGSTGKTFRDVVVIGIGGSYLGTEFVSCALEPFADRRMHLYFLANVDIDDFGTIAERIDPERTLWIVISKSYTTTETLANANQAYAFMEEKGLEPSRHFVTVTSRGSPGDDPESHIIRSFHMFDYIGGRYSVSSAVGGVPLSLYLGYDRFERFLKGAREMDIHAENAAPEKNLPLIGALIGIWNNNFLHYSNLGIIPYSSPLRKLPAHIQQLYMESNGKSVDENGNELPVSSGVIVFGEPGTNAQHSFFQLAHQGRPFPVDFIGVLKPSYDQYKNRSKGVTNHQELWANLISQPMALAQGKEDENPAKRFEGNRPSTTLVLDDLSAESVGRLLSYYEARTVLEAFVWGINPFDQFGVELGKKLASDVRKTMVSYGEEKKDTGALHGPIVSFYLDRLLST